MDAPLPTDRELAILQVLWDREEATARQIHEDLAKDLPIVQNTVQTFLRVLLAKGLVSFRREGRQFIYKAEVDPEPTQQGLLNRVLEDVYRGSVDQLVAGALSLRSLDRSEIEGLQKLLSELEEREDD